MSDDNYVCFNCLKGFHCKLTPSQCACAKNEHETRNDDDPSYTGTEFADICQAWEANHALYLGVLRDLAVEFASRRHSEVTIDDVRDEMRRKNIPFPVSLGIDTRIFGAVLRGCHDLQLVGFRTTAREEWAQRVGKAREKVGVYRLAPRNEGNYEQ